MEQEIKSEKNKRPLGARRLVLWATLVLLIVLTVLSVYSAFLGSAKATVFFNSPPLVAFWFLLTALFAMSFFMVPNLRVRPGLLLSHLGCLLVLMGAIWGSEGAHKLRTAWFGSSRMREGFMQIHEGQSDVNVYPSGGGAVLGQLPFSVALDDFWIEYYESRGSLLIVPEGGDKTFELKAEAGESLSLGEDKPKVRILRTFENFKIYLDGGKSVAHDEKGAGENPALEVEITLPDGKVTTRYVFARPHGQHAFSYEGLDLTYRYGGPSGIKDYKSSLAVLEDGEPVVRKIIEVNKPLHYGGYSFYQSSYDQERGHFTVLSVVSSSGLWLVFPGYALLCAGVIWQCWLRHIKRPLGAVS